MNGETNDLLETLREILKWVRIQAQPIAKSRIEAALPEAAHRRLYQALDGKQTQKQLAAMLKISQPTVSRLINAWMRCGIVEEISAGRYIKSFNLDTLGIDLNPKGAIKDVH